MKEGTTDGRIGRRQFLKRTSLGLGAFALARSGAWAQSKPLREDVSRPNIVFILTDDIDKRAFNCYGGHSWMPNIDRLAREGMVFDNFFTTTAICTPSRYGFYTGRYPGRSTSETYLNDCPPGKQGFINFNMALEEDNMNVARVLADNGYVTGQVGKYHVGPILKKKEDYEKYGLQYVPRDAKPDRASSQAFRHNELWYREYLKRRGFSWAKHVYWGNLQKPFERHNPEWTVEAALEFIEENRNRPFYLHYCTTLCHGGGGSWRKSMDYPQFSGEGLIDTLPQVMTDRKVLLRQIEEKGFDSNGECAGYAWMDDSVGAILKKLDDLGLAENTLVVFASDNGRDGKSSLYSLNGVCLPCVARWPKGIKAGTRCAELTQNVDLAATYFALAGTKPPREYVLDGRSLTPLFDTGKPKAWRDHLYLEVGCARAVATKEWKYIAIRYTKEQVEAIRAAKPERLPRLMSYIGGVGISTRGAGTPGFYDGDQLYNLTQDPAEQRNLAKDPAHRGRLDAMKAMLASDLKSFQRPYGEFLPGGNAAPGGQVEKQIAMVKTIRVEHKTVVLPGEEEGEGEDRSDAPAPKAPSPSDPTGQRATIRAGKKAERQKVRTGGEGE